MAVIQIPCQYGTNVPWAHHKPHYQAVGIMGSIKKKQTPPDAALSGARLRTRTDPGRKAARSETAAELSVVHRLFQQHTDGFAKELSINLRVICGGKSHTLSQQIKNKNRKTLKKPEPSQCQQPDIRRVWQKPVKIQLGVGELWLHSEDEANLLLQRVLCVCARMRACMCTFVFKIHSHS